MEKEYQFLCEFTRDTHPTKSHLTKRHGESALSEAIDMGWVEKFKMNRAVEKQFLQ